METNSYKNLIVWQKAMELVDEVYKLTKKFSGDEKFGIVLQMKRTAISIPSNIAEGYRRNSPGFYGQFLSIAYGSGGELETQIEICKRNLNLNREEYINIERLLGEVMKILNVLIQKLRTTRYELRAKKGFTVVELLVAIALFAVIVTIASGVFIKSMRTQRFAAALMAASGNAQLALEQMAREMRTGQNFSSLGGELRFINAKGESVVYRFRNAAIEREVSGNARVLTAENALVRNLKFIVTGDLDTDGYPPKITSILQVGAKGLPFEDAVVNLQTTISSRILDG